MTLMVALCHSIFWLSLISLALIGVECRPPQPPADNSVLSVDKLQPPDHLDGVKLEQDGHLNKDFHKEAFLGNHEEIDGDPEEVAESKLKDIFHKFVYIVCCIIYK